MVPEIPGVGANQQKDTDALLVGLTFRLESFGSRVGRGTVSPKRFSARVTLSLPSEHVGMCGGLSSRVEASSTLVEGALVLL